LSDVLELQNKTNIQVKLGSRILQYFVDDWNWFWNVCCDVWCSFLIANDCRLCDNDHVFCHSCIVAWSM